MVQQIPLYRYGEVVSHVLVDDEDYEWASAYRWSMQAGYATRTERVTDAAGTVKQKQIPMHRAILERMGIDMTGQLTDHINRTKTDNRRSNLRASTTKQNSRNRGVNVGKLSSRYKGVVPNGNVQGPAWKATVYVDGKAMQLGNFDTEAQAAAAYNEAAIKHFGEFAALNVIEDDAVVIQALRQRILDLEQLVSDLTWQRQSAGDEAREAKRENRRLKDANAFLKAANTRVTKAYNELYDQQHPIEQAA